MVGRLRPKGTGHFKMKGLDHSILVDQFDSGITERNRPLRGMVNFFILLSKKKMVRLFYTQIAVFFCRGGHFKIKTAKFHNRAIGFNASHRGEPRREKGKGRRQKEKGKSKKVKV
jgi:hypothetical protein